MSSYRPIDSKKEEFRKYLEKAGAMDALTKVLVMLYDEPEKPADALEYIRKHLGGDAPDEMELETLKTDLEGALLTVQTLTDEINVLRERLAQYEPEEKSLEEEEEHVTPAALQSREASRTSASAAPPIIPEATSEEVQPTY